MHELIQNTHIPETLLKVIAGLMSALFLAVIGAFSYVVKLVWNASKKVTEVDKSFKEIDRSLKEHENDLINHKVDDAKEFSIVAKALDAQKEEFEKMQDAYNKTNVMIERFIGAAEVHFEHTKERLNRIENDMRKI